MNGEMAQLCDIAIASKIALKTKNKISVIDIFVKYVIINT